MKIPIALFRLGRIVATPGVLSNLTRTAVTRAISRHQAGDWGELSLGDCQLNYRALETGGRLLSAYISEEGIRFWVITEADRSATTILLPHEY